MTYFFENIGGGIYLALIGAVIVLKPKVASPYVAKFFARGSENDIFGKGEVKIDNVVMYMLGGVLFLLGMLIVVEHSV